MRLRSERRAWVLLLMLACSVGSLAVVHGCAGPEDASVPPASVSDVRGTAATTANVGQAAAARKIWLQQLRAAHRAADDAQTDAQRGAAASAFRQLLPHVPAAAAAAEWLWVKQDAHGRIARLESQSGQLAAALAECEAGLALSTAPSVAVSNLFLLKGQVLEQLERKGDAAEAYHQALLVNEVLMKRSLGEE